MADQDVISTSETSATTEIVDETQSLAHQVKQHDFLIKVAIIGIVGAIILLAIDLYRDNTLHQRITELEHDIYEYNAESLKQQYLIEKFQLNVESLKMCLKNGGWSKCF